MPVMVRNTRRGPTVFHDRAKMVTINWEGSGAEDGMDIQPVPDEVYNNPQFQQNVRKGVFEIEDPENATVKRAMEAQVEGFKAREDAKDSEQAEVIDRQATRDVVFRQDGSEVKPEMVQITDEGHDNRGEVQWPERTPTPEEPLTVEQYTDEFDDEGRPVTKPMSVSIGEALPSQQ